MNKLLRMPMVIKENTDTIPCVFNYILSNKYKAGRKNQLKAHTNNPLTYRRPECIFPCLFSSIGCSIGRRASIRLDFIDVKQRSQYLPVEIIAPHDSQRKFSRSPIEISSRPSRINLLIRTGGIPVSLTIFSRVASPCASTNSLTFLKSSSSAFSQFGQIILLAIVVNIFPQREQFLISIKTPLSRY